MVIEFKWYDITQLKAILSRFINRIGNFRGVFNQIADDFYKVEEAQFTTQGGRGSQGRWKTLSSKYAVWKAKNYPGRPIMVLTGDLKASLTSRGGDNVREVTERQCILGTADVKAEWHTKGKGRLSKRSPIDLASKDKSRWMKMIHTWIVNSIQKLELNK